MRLCCLQSRMLSPKLLVDSAVADSAISNISNKERLRVVCPYTGCDKVFASRGHWQRHEQSVHCGIRVPCCVPGCERSFTRTDKMREHVRRAHSGGATAAAAAAAAVAEDDGGVGHSAPSDSLINAVMSSLWAVDGTDRLHQL